MLLAAGMLKMSPMTFLLADGSSALLTVALWGGVGYVGGENIETLKQQISRIELIAILCLLSAFAGWTVLKYFRAGRSFVSGDNGEEQFKSPNQNTN